MASLLRRSRRRYPLLILCYSHSVGLRTRHPHQTIMAHRLHRRIHVRSWEEGPCIGTTLPFPLSLSPVPSPATGGHLYATTSSDKNIGYMKCIEDRKHLTGRLSFTISLAGEEKSGARDSSHFTAVVDIPLRTLPSPARDWRSLLGSSASITHRVDFPIFYIFNRDCSCKN